jgi:IS1 family transposase/transposase-like protein
MKITITLHCPDCQSTKVKKNGKKISKKQNYLCKACGRQFIGDHALCYKGCHSGLLQKILLMLVRGIGIRDIAEIEKVSTKKVLSVLVNSRHLIQPRKQYYDCLEVDELWTYVGRKSRKIWLITLTIEKQVKSLRLVCRKRDLKTAGKLKKKLSDSIISYGSIATDDWDSFVSTFKRETHLIGIEGNNCRLRHRIRRVFRKTCCFSKKLLNHFKAFNLAFFYINFGFV